MKYYLKNNYLKRLINRFQQKHKITNIYQIYGLAMKQYNLTVPDISKYFIEQMYKLFTTVMDTKIRALALLIFVGNKIEMLTPGIFNITDLM